jgi:TraK protein
MVSNAKTRSKPKHPKQPINRRSFMFKNPKPIVQIVVCLLLALCACLGQVPKAFAKTVGYGSAVEQVRIKFGTPTVFRFPKSVQTVTGANRLEVKPANPADPSYTVLAVTPRFTNGVNEVSFFLTDGTVVRTRIVVSPNDPAADSLYDFKPQEAVSDGDSENAPPVTEVELLKAMVRDDEVSGYSVSHTSESRSAKDGVEIELIRIYKGSPFNGYVFRLTNTNSHKNIDVDVRHVTVGDPNLAVLSQSDDAVLYPKDKGPYQTLLRVVAKNTASSRDVVIAMEPENAEAKKKEGK